MYTSLMPVAVDHLTQHWLSSSAPQPTQAHLDQILERVYRVQLLSDGAALGEPLGTAIVADTDDREAIRGLKDSLRVVDGGAGHCMCFGDAALVLLNGDGERLAVIGVHHGHAIRWDAWRDDAALADGERLCRWLAAHGLQSPLEQLLASRQDQAKQADQLQAWRTATPECLTPFLEGMMAHQRGAFDLEPLDKALTAAFPEPVEKACALLEWLGHGDRPWNGFNAHEGIPLKILEMMQLDALLGALRTDELTEAQLEGAARFFSGWHFQKRGEQARARLLDSDRDLLLAHVQRTGDPEAIQRVQELLSSDRPPA
ncbi:MAG TPA: hypothetical protein VG937_31465 [Polyangiaceae bacterium]|nr:hypothetical protein [Polyangiaceae bacterium]